MSRLSIDKMRKAISSAYDSKTWHERVHKMNPNQVAAIYKKMKSSSSYILSNGLFKRVVSDDQNDTKNDEYHQIDIWEYLNSIK